MTDTPKAMLELAERRIIAVGHRLAAQLGGEFSIVPEKLADYRRRAHAKEQADG